MEGNAVPLGGQSDFIWNYEPRGQQVQTFSFTGKAGAGMMSIVENETRLSKLNKIYDQIKQWQLLRCIQLERKPMAIENIEKQSALEIVVMTEV